MSMTRRLQSPLTDSQAARKPLPPHDQSDHEQDQEHEWQDLCDPGGLAHGPPNPGTAATTATTKKINAHRNICGSRDVLLAEQVILRLSAVYPGHA
jgi:hypothetical protein